MIKEEGLGHVGIFFMQRLSPYIRRGPLLPVNWECYEIPSLPGGRLLIQVFEKNPERYTAGLEFEHLETAPAEDVDLVKKVIHDVGFVEQPQ